MIEIIFLKKTTCTSIINVHILLYCVFNYTIALVANHSTSAKNFAHLLSALANLYYYHKYMYKEISYDIKTYFSNGNNSETI